MEREHGNGDILYQAICRMCNVERLTDEAIEKIVRYIHSHLWEIREWES